MGKKRTPIPIRPTVRTSRDRSIAAACIGLLLVTSNSQAVIKKKAPPSSMTGLAATQNPQPQTGVAVSEKKKKPNSLGLSPSAQAEFENTIKMPAQTFVDALKKKGPTPIIRTRSTLMDAAKTDIRYQNSKRKKATSAINRYAPGASMNVVLAAPGSRNQPQTTAHASQFNVQKTAGPSAHLPEEPLAAVVINNKSADLARLILPRFTVLALESYIAQNKLDTEMAPIFPDKQSDSQQSTTYSRIDPAPVPGTFRVSQRKTDLIHERIDFDILGLDLWLNYDVNLENFEVEIPLNSNTFEVQFNEPDQIKTDMNIGDAFKMKFSGSFKMSSALQATVIASGAVLAALVGTLSGGLGFVLFGLVSVATFLEGNTYFATVTVGNTRIESLVLVLEKGDSPYLIKEAKKPVLSIGQVTIFGAEFLNIIDVFLPLFNGKLASGLGLEGTNVESCSSFNDCVNDIVEIYFNRGSLEAKADEECWQPSGEPLLDPKSLKCTLSASLNSALQSMSAISLGDPGRTVSVLKKASDIKSNKLRVQLDVDLASDLPRGRCSAELPDYQPKTYQASEGGADYSLKSKGALSLFLPLNALEKAVHITLQEGAYCRRTRSTFTDPTTGLRTQFKILPAGQFEAESVLAEPLFISSSRSTRSPVGATIEFGAGLNNPTPSAATQGTLRYIKLKAPFSALMEIGARRAPESMTVSASMSGILEATFLIELSCSRINGITIRPTHGAISGLTGTVSSATGTVSCSDASCPYYTNMHTEFSSLWSSTLLSLAPITLPSLTSFTDAHLFLMLDGTQTEIIEDKALRLPLNVSDTNPCQETQPIDDGNTEVGGGGRSPDDPAPAQPGFPGAIPHRTEFDPTDTEDRDSERSPINGLNRGAVDAISF
jgi:hypothetical protein